MKMTEDTMRNEFEAWAQTGPRVLHLMLNSSLGPANGRVYWADETETAWLAWQAATRAAVPAWQPIETAPRTSKAILVWVPENKCTFVVTWCDNRDTPRWEIFGGGFRSFLGGDGPSHWMPLPPAPEVKP